MTKAAPSTGANDRIGGVIAVTIAKPRVLACAILAFLLSGASLLGWAIGSPTLAGFGLARYPNWPWTGVIYMVLPVAFLAEQAGERLLARLLIVAPVAIAILAFAEYFGLGAAGFDRLLFPGALAAFPLATAGRPGLIATLSILLVSGSIVLMARRGGRTAQILLLANALAIGLNLMSATLLLLGTDGLDQTIRIASSLPACLPPILIALATIEWMTEQGRQRVMTRISSQWRIGRVVLPVVIGLPAVIQPILDRTETAGLLPHLTIQILGSTVYLLLTTGVLVWSLTRITREHDTLAVLTRALDTVPIIMTDRADRITHWSAGCETLFGWTAAEAIGQRIDFHLHIGPADMATLRPDGVPTPLRDILATRRDGTTVALRAQAAKVGGEGQAEGSQIAIALTDTTSLRKAQTELEASEAKLQIAIEAHSIGIFDRDVVNDRIHWNLHAAIHNGATPGRVVDYAAWSALVEPSDLIAIEERREEALAAQVPQYSFRYRIRTPDGSHRVIEGSTRAFYDENGEPVRMIGVTMDVTEREERATALELREAQLRSIIATIPDAMIITARDGLVRHASETAGEMFGCATGELVGQPLSTFILNRTVSESGAEAPLRPGTGPLKPGRPRDLIGRRAGGEEFPIELVVAKTAHEQDAEFIAFVRDLTDRKAEEARVEALSAEYAHFARMTAVGAMASTLAHELNQPLAACSNFLATARLLSKRGETGERVTEMLGQAGDQIIRAGEIIRRTREFVAKNESDVSVEALKPLIQEAVSLGMTGSNALKIQTRFEFDDNAPEAVVDRIQIQQVIVNLVRNAAEALRGRRFGTREIVIATQAIDAETVEVTVRDNGPGIPKTLLETIGSPFQSTKQSGSMGLGLSICRRIIEAHGGQFTARNDEGGGAVFSFTIPSWSEPHMAEALR